MATSNVEATSFVTYGYVNESDEDKAMGTIFKVNKDVAYEEALDQVQKNVLKNRGSDGGVSPKVVGSPSARIIMMLPPLAPKDLLPRVKAVMDRLPPE